MVDFFSYIAYSISVAAKGEAVFHTCVENCAWCHTDNAIIHWVRNDCFI